MQWFIDANKDHTIRLLKLSASATWMWKCGNSLSCLPVQSINWRDRWKNRTSRYIFSAGHSMVFYFRCCIYWWKGIVRL